MSGDEAYWWLGEENGTELIQTTDGWSDLLLSHRNGLCLATSASSRAKGNQRDKLLFEHNITWHYQPRLAGHRVWKVLRYPCVRQSEWWQQGNAYQRQTGLLIKSAIVHVRQEIRVILGRGKAQRVCSTYRITIVSAVQISLAGFVLWEDSIPIKRWREESIPESP